MADTSSISLAERVARGAKLLDEKRPGWAAEIATDKLAMESCDRCILGQLYGHYFAGYEALRRQLPSDFLFSALGHGFTLSTRAQFVVLESEGPEGVIQFFDPLADLWRAEIARRLNSSPIPNGD